jgi:hypothetical protein
MVRAELAENAGPMVTESGVKLPRIPYSFTCRLRIPLKPLTLVSDTVEVAVEPILMST